MELRSIFPAFLYLLLLSPAVIFINKTIQQYLNGATTYSETQEPLTLSDLPTIAICFDFGDKILTYGLNISFDATFIEDQNSTVKLVENRNVSTWLGVEMHLSKLKLLSSMYDNPLVKPEYQCFKITPHLNDSKDIDFRRFSIKLEISFSNESSKCNGGKIFPLTEKNSYGVTHGRWFDGPVLVKSVPKAGWWKRYEANYWSFFHQIL